MSDRPAELQLGPVSIPYAVIGLGAVLLLAVVLIGGLGLLGSISNSNPHTDCDLLSQEPIGWVELDVGRMSTIGDSHTLSREADVLAERAKPRSWVCDLPRGTRIEVRERPNRGRDGTWLRVYGEGIALPR